MAQITRCPSCGTMFKVVPDQLKVSGGWVRCGHCAEAFDARLHMQQEADLATAGLADAAMMPAGQDSPALGPGHATAPMGASSPAPSVTSAPSSLETAPGSGSSAAGSWAALSALANHPVPQADSLAHVLLEPDVDGADPLPGKGVGRQPLTKVAPPSSPGTTRSISHQPGLSRAEMQDLAFMRQSRARLFWSSPLVRGTLGLLAMLLFLSLGLQVAMDQRDRLAAIEPAAKPWLQQLCAPLGCVVSPLRQLESLAIEGSSFHKMAPQAYRLGIALRNAGTLEVATPMIELTLTDAQEQALARRVLNSSELGMPLAIGAGTEWTGTVVLRLSPTVGEVAGYRVLAFYP